MEYNVKLSLDDLKIIGAGLSELPFKFAAPLIQKLNSQVNEQAKSEEPKGE